MLMLLAPPHSHGDQRFTLHGARRHRALPRCVASQAPMQKSTQTLISAPIELRYAHLACGAVHRCLEHSRAQHRIRVNSHGHTTRRTAPMTTTKGLHCCSHVTKSSQRCISRYNELKIRSGTSPISAQSPERRKKLVRKRCRLLRG